MHGMMHRTAFVICVSENAKSKKWGPDGFAMIFYIAYLWTHLGLSAVCEGARNIHLFNCDFQPIFM